MKQFLFLIYLLPLIGLSQTKQNEKLTIDLNSGVYTNFNKWKENGAAVGLEVSFKRKYIILRANIQAGFGISKNITSKDGYIQAFLESDILLGKQLHLSNSISIIPQTGLGYLHLTNHFQGDKENLIGLPLQFKILFFTNKDVAFGLVPKANFNKVQNNYSLSFTVNFKS